MFSVLAGTVTMPAIRPALAALGMPAAFAHAFLAASLVGGIVGAPFIAARADRWRVQRVAAALFALLDGVGLLLVASGKVGPHGLLAVRFIQGASSGASLSILLGMSGHGDKARSSMAFAGAGLVTAIALGAPVGAAFLTVHPLGPWFAGAGMQALVAIAIWLSPVNMTHMDYRATARVSFVKVARAVMLPSVWVAVERFGVGCFVVTFAFFIHDVHHLSDARVGELMTWLVATFALSMYPLGRYGAGMHRGVLLSLGLVVYAGAMALLGVVPVVALRPLLAVAGFASSAIYAPSLCLAATAVEPEVRSTGMGVVHSAGSIGMFLGCTVAGILSGTRATVTLGEVTISTYQLIFTTSSVACLVALAVTANALRRMTQKDPALERSPVVAREARS